jgi:hypothetical protein
LWSIFAGNTCSSTGYSHVSYQSPVSSLQKSATLARISRSLKPRLQKFPFPRRLLAETNFDPTGRWGGGAI